LFYDVCNKGKLDYHYIVCRSENFTGNDSDRPAADITADIYAIECKVKFLLSDRRGHDDVSRNMELSKFE
jgi:hypothetical protein